MGYVLALVSFSEPKRMLTHIFFGVAAYILAYQLANLTPVPDWPTATFFAFGIYGFFMVRVDLRKYLVPVAVIFIVFVALRFGTGQAGFLSIASGLVPGFFAGAAISWLARGLTTHSSP